MGKRWSLSILLVGLLALGLVMLGCEATQKAAEHKTATGAAVGGLGGAAVGAGLGAAVGHPGVGALIGGGVGATAGGFIGHEMQKKEETKKEEEEAAKQAATPEAAPERRQIDGRWHVKKRVEEPPGSGNFKEVWVPETGK